MDGADLAFAGLARHADLIAAGEISSRELTELFLARIERLQPVLNAYRVVLGESALARGRRGGRAARPGAPAATASRSRSRTTSTSPARPPPTAATPTRTPQPADSEVVRAAARRRAP